jgi:ParB/RepB/Spo0J family partition protein
MGKRTLKPAPVGPDIEEGLEDLDDDLGTDVDETLVVRDDDDDDLWDSDDEDEGENIKTPREVDELAEELSAGIDQRDIDAANPAVAEREETAPAKLPDGSDTEAATAQVEHLTLTDIAPDPEQPRLEVDDELAASIRSQGVLQPIVVRPDPRTGFRIQACMGGRFELVNPHHVTLGTFATESEAQARLRDVTPHYMIVDGERRWRGSKTAGRTTIPARIVYDVDDVGERLLRQVTLNEGKRLAPMEEANAWKRIMDAKGWTIVQLATVLGRAKSTVSDRLALLDAPLPFHKYFLDGTLTAAAAPIVRRFAGVTDKVAQQMIEFAKSGPDWEKAVEDGKPVPLKVVEQELELSVEDEMPVLRKDDPVTDRYDGPSVMIKKVRYALDPDRYNAIDRAVTEEESAVHPAGSPSAPAPKVKRTPDPYVAKQREQAKRAHEKSELRATQIRLLMPKLPKKLDRGWGLFLVSNLVRELTNDSQRHAVKVLGITPPENGQQRLSVRQGDSEAC